MFSFQYLERLIKFFFSLFKPIVNRFIFLSGGDMPRVSPEGVHPRLWLTRSHNQALRLQQSIGEESVPHDVWRGAPDLHGFLPVRRLSRGRHLDARAKDLWCEHVAVLHIGHPVASSHKVDQLSQVRFGILCTFAFPSVLHNDSLFPDIYFHQGYNMYKVEQLSHEQNSILRIWKVSNFSKSCH